MAKWCFLGFFVGFNVEKVFWCVWYCFKSVKNACFFSQFWGFSGVAHCCSSGFERLRSFCVSGVCFFVWLLFLFRLLCSWPCGWMLLFCFFLVIFSCCFLLFCFFFWRVQGSGEVAQRATSLGPKPSLLFFSCFLPFCFSFLFLVLAFSFCFVWFLRLSCSLVSVFLFLVLFYFES